MEEELEPRRWQDDAEGSVDDVMRRAAQAGLLRRANRGISGKGGVLRSWKRVNGQIGYNAPVWVLSRSRHQHLSCRGMRQRRGSSRSARRPVRARRSSRSTSSSSPPGEPEPALAGSQLRSIGAALEAFLASLLVKSAAISGCTLEECTARVIAGWDEPAPDLTTFVRVAARATALVSA
jgi:hypothetical protein